MFGYTVEMTCFVRMLSNKIIYLSCRFTFIQVHNFAIKYCHNSTETSIAVMKIVEVERESSTEMNKMLINLILIA